ncbi:uncharacterized protein LOC129581465 [Paramacrobiotus metropolitanus]|uniref:uncharacterized protein LOC129581465 n=1 Tax=Paramacrobiotus metropolitanus TaxID=2943436 RepID=UPI0024465357|nr:uncharacterized protein LOC129581465 [Paramacrobiotus metropolitanus]XP_055328541.1 uncharacterized protein LOC129581465 [Paramacrobiotus metropolitanus]
MDESPVKIHIYDLSKGLARMFSQMYLGKHLEGVWHTGIVVYGKEYFYGSMGIESCPPGTTVLGPPDTIVDLGTTALPYEIFMDWLNGAAMTTFKGSRYHLFDHNCNTFSSELAQFLTGKRLPSYVTDLTADVVSTPLGQQIRAMLESVQNSATATPVGPDPSREFVSSRTPVFDPEEEELIAAAQAAVSAPLPRATPRLRDPNDSEDDLDDLPTSAVSNLETKKPITCNDVDVTEAYGQLQTILHGKISVDDMEILDEIFEYATASDEAALLLSISKSHFTFLNDILLSEDLKVTTKLPAVRLLQSLTRTSSAVNVLRFCPEHPVMEYLLFLGKQRNPDNMELVEALKMVCNACSTASGFSWMTDETEWAEDEDAGHSTSNLLATVQFCAWCLSKAHKDVQATALALAYNLSIPDIPEQPAAIVYASLLKFISQPANCADAALMSTLIGTLNNFTDANSVFADRLKTSGIDWDGLQSKHPKLKEPIKALLQKAH